MLLACVVFAQNAHAVDCTSVPQIYDDSTFENRYNTNVGRQGAIVNLFTPAAYPYQYKTSALP